MGKHQDVVPFIDATPRSFRSRLGSRASVTTHRALNFESELQPLDREQISALAREARKTAASLRRVADPAYREVNIAMQILLQERNRRQQEYVS